MGLNDEGTRIRVFMLGWEFPPFISGGLGTACYGLTKALDQLGVKVTFVLPKMVDSQYATHVKLLTPNARKQSFAGRTSRREELANVNFRSIVSPLQAYSTPQSYDEKVQEILRLRRESVAAADGLGEAGDRADYAGDLYREVRRYASMAMELAKGEEFDVVHAHDWMTYPAGIGVAMASGKPLVVEAPTMAGSEGRTTVYARDNITQNDVIYHPAEEKNGSLIITATHLLSGDYDCRIVAEDENHHVFEPIRTNNSGGKMRLCISVLKVPRDQVKWFRLQARLYEWVEFKNIRLIPASTALNRGESSSAPTVATQAPADVAVEEQGKPVSPPSATGQGSGESSSVPGATPGVEMQWPVSQGGNGHFYQVVCVTKGLTWDEANAAAQAQGGYLATITSAEENAFVFALIQDPACWNGPRGPWIGGYQTPGRPVRQDWHWVTGEPFEYNHWSPNQPNDGGGADETRLEYGWGATTIADTWNDQPDWFRGVYAYVVEREPGGPTQSAAQLNAWVSLQVLGQRVVVLDTLKPFFDHWSRLRHKVVGALSEKETLDYLRGRLQDKKSLPIRVHIYYLPETKSAVEDLRQQIFALAREANAERDTDVRLEPSFYVGSGESPFYLREGRIRTFYPRSMPRPDGGPEPIRSGLVDPNDLEQHILWRLTMPKNLPLTFRIEYDEASSQLARQVANIAKAVAQRVGLTDLVGVTGALVDPIPEGAFLGKWQALGEGIIQSIDIQPTGVCQVLVGEGSPALKAGASITGTWVWTVREIQLDINDPIEGTWDRDPLHYAYRAAVSGEGNLVIGRGEIWPQGSFMHTRPPEMIFKKVQ